MQEVNTMQQVWFLPAGQQTLCIPCNKTSWLLLTIQFTVVQQMVSILDAWRVHKLLLQITLSVFYSPEISKYLILI